jgi:AraC-like DNA-binding protein
VSRRWTVAGLAKGVGLSRSSLAVRFRDVSSDSPLQYLSRYRLEKAARLLRSSDAGVAETHGVCLSRFSGAEPVFCVLQERGLSGSEAE